MIYALDTNVISHLLRPGYNVEVVRCFESAMELGHDYVIPPLSYYEIVWWLLHKKATAQLRVFQEFYQNAFVREGMDESDIYRAAQIRAELTQQGQPIGKSDSDIFIAAYCLNRDYTLVTHNLSDFERIDGLKIVNWKG